MDASEEVINEVTSMVYITIVSGNNWDTVHPK